MCARRRRRRGPLRALGHAPVSTLRTRVHGVVSLASSVRESSRISTSYCARPVALPSRSLFGDCTCRVEARRRSDEKTSLSRGCSQYLFRTLVDKGRCCTTSGDWRNRVAQLRHRSLRPRRRHDEAPLALAMGAMEIDDPAVKSLRLMYRSSLGARRMVGVRFSNRILCFEFSGGSP